MTKEDVRRELSLQQRYQKKHLNASQKELLNKLANTGLRIIQQKGIVLTSAFRIYDFYIPKPYKICIEITEDLKDGEYGTGLFKGYKILKLTSNDAKNISEASLKRLIEKTKLKTPRACLGLPEKTNKNQIVDYKVYLASKWWKSRRKNYWARHKEAVCCCCGKKAEELHHITYQHLFKEKDCHLLPICRKCHKGIHKMIKEDVTGTLNYSNTHLHFQHILGE